MPKRTVCIKYITGIRIPQMGSPEPLDENVELNHVSRQFTIPSSLRSRLIQKPHHYQAHLPKLSYLTLSSTFLSEFNN